MGQGTSARDLSMIILLEYNNMHNVHRTLVARTIARCDSYVHLSIIPYYD